MLDSINTFKRFGYNAKELSLHSKKKIIAICDVCKKERILSMGDYRKLCQKCAAVKTIKLRIKNRRSYKGKNNPNYGKQHNEETKRKMATSNYRLNAKGTNASNYKAGRTLRKHYCIDCNKEVSYKSEFEGLGRCKSCSRLGKLHHNYIDGKSVKYPVEFNENLKTKIRKKYKFVCQVCSKNGWFVHHIDYVKENCKEDNLTNLCQSCHSKTNFNRDYWKNYFKELVLC